MQKSLLQGAVKLAVQRREEVEEIDQSLGECLRVVENVEAVLNDIRKVEEELHEINSKLRNYDCIDSIARNSRQLKKNRNLEELFDISLCIKEPLEYFNKDRETNLHYIALAERLSNTIECCINNALISAMESGGEAFVTRKDVRKAVKLLGTQMKQKFRETYFLKRRDEYRKKVWHCKCINEDIVRSLSEHEVSLFNRIFEGEDSSAFLSRLLSDYFDSLKEEQIQNRLHKYKKGDPFLDSLHAYSKKKGGNRCQEIYEI